MCPYLENQPLGLDPLEETVLVNEPEEATDETLIKQETP
jgi:hypothetical protein